MICVTVTIDGNGVLNRVEATGHSTASVRGENIVCAAATVLIRTAARLLDSDADIKITGSARSRGALDFSVVRIDDGKHGYVRAVGDYLMRGITDLQEEFPDECVLKIDR